MVTRFVFYLYVFILPLCGHVPKMELSYQIYSHVAVHDLCKLPDLLKKTLLPTNFICMCSFYVSLYLCAAIRR